MRRAPGIRLLSGLLASARKGAARAAARAAAKDARRTAQKVAAPTAKTLVCLLCALAGATVALRAAPATDSHTRFGVVAAWATPARHGVVDAYVPLVDWGAKAHPFRAPVAVRLELTSVDRPSLLAALGSGDAAQAAVKDFQSDLQDLVAAELLRAALFAVLGGLVGGLLAGALLAALGGPQGQRRLWLGLGPLLGVATVSLAAAAVALSIGQTRPGDLRQATYYAHGSELPQVLAFASQIEDASARYSESYERALAGLARLVSYADGQEPADPTAAATGRQGLEVVVASDLHSNTLVMPALAGYARGRPVFMPGDFTELGADYESGVVAAVKRLHGDVYAVSGNHDSRPFMRRLVRNHVHVLTRSGLLRRDGTTTGEPVVEVDGLKVAGSEDPLESKTARLASHDLELSPAALERAKQKLLDWFDALPARPDVVLVHQHSLALALLQHAAAVKGAPTLLVMTGHDHRQHLDRLNGSLLVDDGTVGAGGPLGVGSTAGFILLHFAPPAARGDAPRLRSLDLIQVEPLSGDASAQHVVVGRQSASVKGLLGWLRRP